MYKPFRNAEIASRWDLLVKMPLTDVEALQAEWRQADADNKAIYQQAQQDYEKKVADVERMLTEAGIEIYIRSGLKKKTAKWFSTNIKEPLRRKMCGAYVPSRPHCSPKAMEIDGIKVSHNQSPATIIEVWKNITHQLQQAKVQQSKEDKLFIICIQKAIELGIDTKDKPREVILSEVTEAVKDKIWAEKYPDGTEVDIDDNYCECEKYTIGGRRCSCGNRRISAYLDGDLLTGFYLATEPY